MLTSLPVQQDGASDARAPHAPAIVSVMYHPQSALVLTDGASTNDTDLAVKVSLAGTGARAGDTVRLYDGTDTAAPLGGARPLTGADIGDGYVTLETGPLTDGTTYDITARVTGAAGDRGAASAAFRVTADTTAPGAPVITGSGGPTNVPTQTVTGTAEPGSTVVLFLDPPSPTMPDEPDLGFLEGPYHRTYASYTMVRVPVLGISTTTAGTDGVWSVDVTLSDQGAYRLSAVTRDAAGNQSAPSSSVSYALDTQAPTVHVAPTTSGPTELRAGRVITLSLVVSEAVAVDTADGTPTLGLSGGGRATYASTGEDGRTLGFSYTVQPGDTADRLSVSGFALNGATIRDAAGNDLDPATSSRIEGTPMIDATVPTVTRVGAPILPMSGVAGPIGLWFAMSEAVVVDTTHGSPTLALSNGGTATFAGAAFSGHWLAFSYTPAAGESAADLAVRGVTLNGATVRDRAGNDADLSGVLARPPGTSASDTAAPAAPIVLGLGARPGVAGFVVRGTAEAGSKVELFDATASLGTTTAAADGGWELAPPGGLDAGAHPLTAVATDAAGNTSAASSSLSLTLQAEPPAGTAPVAADLDTGARGVRVTRTDAGDAIVTRGSETRVLRNTDEVRFIDGRLVFDQDDPAFAVARLYHAALGRDIDQGGLDHWTKAVQGGTGLDDVARGLLTSIEGRSLYGVGLSDAEFVARLYRTALGREGDAGGQAFWTGRLRDGASRADALAAVSESGESRAVAAAANPGGVWDADEDAARVARLYDAVFGRLPDQAGLAYWTRAVHREGATLADVAEGLMASLEYQATHGALSTRDFVEAVHRNALDRPGEAPGVDHWTRRLDAGLNRAVMVASFSESPEHVGLTAADVTGGTPGGFGIRIA